jgi:peptide/nickel transport system permease protein
VVLIATFSIIRLIPGDVVDLMVQENAYAPDTDAMRRQLGLDKPLHLQFIDYVGNAIQGDLGKSLWTKEPVIKEIRKRLPVSAELAIFSMIVSLIIALPIGILAAIRQDTWADYIARSTAILMISVPNFWVATLVLVLPAIWWGWAPPVRYKHFFDDPLGNLYVMLIPALLLGHVLAGSVMRMTRTMMLEVLRQDYIRTAWSKGLRERSVVIRHALKNAMLPVLTIIGLQTAALLGGSIIVEQIFNLPGMGQFAYRSVIERDYPVLQGVVLFIAVVVIGMNLLIDLMYAYLDPRIRYR